MAEATYGRGFVDITARMDGNGLSGFQSSFVSKMGGVASLAGTALVAGIGAAVAAGAAGIAWSLGEALSQQDAARDAGARLGLSPEESAALGAAAATAYTDGWGESVEANTLVAEEVMRRWGDDLSAAALESVTSTAAGLGDVFGRDSSELINAADQLFSNDLVGSAEEGLDLVTKLLQETSVPDEALEAINEYSSSFAQLGFGAGNVLGGLTSDYATNQYEIDKLGDAVKEFGIRVIDGSDLTKDSLEALGFDVADVNAAYAEGGATWTRTSQDILGAITSLDDPILQNQVGVGLLGTQWEDLKDNVIPILGDMLDGYEGFGGASQEALDASVGPADRISAALRGVKQSVIDSIGGALVPIFEGAVPYIETVAKWLGENLPGAIETVTGWITGLSGNTSGLMSTFQGVWSTISGVVQVAVEIIGDLLANMRQWFEENRGTIEKVMGQIQQVIKTVTEAISRLWNTWGETIMALVRNSWSTISGIISGVLDVVLGLLDTFIGLFTGDWDRMKEGLLQVWDGLWNTVKSVLEGVWGQIQAVIANFPEDLKQSGIDMVTGLWEGIKSMGSWLADKIGGFISDNVPGPIKSVLGISSPSKVAAELGRMVPLGLAVGMNAEEPAVRSAAAGIARATLPALSGTRAGLATVTPIGAGRAGGMFDGATFIQQGTPEELARKTARQVALEVRAS